MVKRQRRPRVLTVLLATQFVVIGALDVLLIVLAFRLLHTGSAGVLNAALARVDPRYRGHGPAG